MKNEDVISKIQKLLRLQMNAEKIGSEGEAFQAAKMVKKLLFEYNLSMSDINDDEEKPSVKINQSMDFGTTDIYGNWWKKNLMAIICENHLCNVYIRGNGKMFIVGAEDNVAIVKEFYNYLTKVFRRLSLEAFNKAQNNAMAQGKRYTEHGMKKYMRSYLEGCVYGLDQNYQSMKPTSEETGLVVCHKQMIDDYLKNADFHISEGNQRKRRKPDIMVDAFLEGEKDGKEVSLNQQINGGNSNKTKRIS